MWQWCGRRCGRHEGLCWVWSCGHQAWQEKNYSFKFALFIGDDCITKECLGFFFTDVYLSELDTKASSEVQEKVQMWSGLTFYLLDLHMSNLSCHHVIFSFSDSITLWVHVHIHPVGGPWADPSLTPHPGGEDMGAEVDPFLTTSWLLPNAMQGDICKP